MKIQAHSTFRHNCCLDPFEGWSDQFMTGGSYTFEAGVEYEVPDQAADYFIRAGWASLPGEEPIKPDPAKPVTIVPDNGTLSSKDSN